MTGLLLLAGYACVIAFVAARASRSESAFFVNNRSASSWSVAFSIIVSCVGASATIGVIGKAFAVGTPAFWWLGCGAAGLWLLALLLSAKIRKSGAYTMPEMTERFLGKAARPLISLIIVIAWPAILGAQFAALQHILAALTGFGPGACLALAFGFIVLHATGGQAVVMRLDRLQVPLILAGLLLVLFLLSAANPAWTAAVRPEAVNDAFPPGTVVYYLLVVGGSYLISPMIFGRFLSAGSVRSARRGGLLAGAGLALCSLLIVSVGLACRGLIPAATPEDIVFTTALEQAISAGVRPFILLALVSAIVSSADTSLVTAATVLTHDLLRRNDLAACRAAVAGLGLAGLALSLADKSILGFLLMAYDVYACGVVAPVFFGLLASPRFAVRSANACAAVALGGCLGATAALTGDPFFSYLGMGSAALCTLAGLRRRAPLVVFQGARL